MVLAKKSPTTKAANKSLTINEGQPQTIDAVPEKAASSERSRDRLIALLSKPDGEQASYIASLMGWQPHTLRAAICRLRRQGLQIATLRGAETGALVYALRSTAAAGSYAGGAEQ